MLSVPFQTILVAIDESDISSIAFAAAIRLAKSLKAKLMIVHVLNPHDPHHSPVSNLYRTTETIEIDESLRQKYEREWIRYVEHYEQLLKQKNNEAIAAGIQADFVHPCGLVGSTLCEIARTNNISLIVVGSHQRRGIAEIMLGSTSNYVMHHAPCSVLVVHPKTQAYKTQAYKTQKAEPLQQPLQPTVNTVENQDIAIA